MWSTHPVLTVHPGGSLKGDDREKRDDLQPADEELLVSDKLLGERATYGENKNKDKELPKCPTNCNMNELKIILRSVIENGLQ